MPLKRKRGGQEVETSEVEEMDDTHMQISVASGSTPLVFFPKLESRGKKSGYSCVFRPIREYSMEAVGPNQIPFRRRPQLSVTHMRPVSPVNTIEVANKCCAIIFDMLYRWSWQASVFISHVG
jgi:hypothetical protein